MGFKDTHMFNLAMGWRLIHTPDSLCAKVLKARYYPNGEVLQARAGRNMSYTWGSILKGIDVLNRGVIWRVGNGSSIKTWSDPWLPREWSRKPITPKGQNVLSRVQELIDPATGGWDDELVRQTFWPQDVDIVLSTPVHHDLEDLVAWHYDNIGNFSVKSAYRVQRDHEKRSSRKGVASSSGVGLAINLQWKRLWKLKYPGKIRHFLWRFAHNSLALRRVLEHRGMEVDTRCVVCNRLNEDGGHLFFKCKHVRAFLARGADGGSASVAGRKKLANRGYSPYPAAERGGADEVDCFALAMVE